MVAKNLMDFTQHYQDAVDAVLNPVAAIGAPAAGTGANRSSRSSEQAC